MIKICMAFPDYSPVATIIIDQNIYGAGLMNSVPLNLSSTTTLDLSIEFFLDRFYSSTCCNTQYQRHIFFLWILNSDKILENQICSLLCRGTCSSFEFWMDSECCSLQKGLPRHPSLLCGWDCYTKSTFSTCRPKGLNSYQQNVMSYQLIIITDFTW